MQNTAAWYLVLSVTGVVLCAHPPVAFTKYYSVLDAILCVPAHG